MGHNTIGPTYAVVDGANHIPNMQILAVIPVYQQLYSLRRQSILLVSFTVMARSKAIIIGRQPFCAVPTWSTAQVGTLVLPCVNYVDI